MISILGGVNLFKVAVLFLCLVNGRSQYLVEKYAPQHENYEIPRYSFAYGISDPASGDHKHQWEKRDGDSVQGEYGLVQPDGMMRLVQYTADDDKGFVAAVKNLKVRVPQYTEGQSLYRVRRRGVSPKDSPTRGQVKEEDNVGSKFIRARYASTSQDDHNRNKYKKNITLADVSDQPIISHRDERSSKKIVKKENSAETLFTFPSAHNSFQYIPNFNLNPLNTDMFKFQNDDQFIRHLSSIQPQHIHQQNYQDYSAVQASQPQAQYYQQILPVKQQTIPERPTYQNSQVTRPKLYINVPDEEEEDDGQNDQRFEHALSLIHSQPHIKSRLENLNQYPNFPPPVSSTPKSQDSGLTYVNGQPKYTNYGYRYANEPSSTSAPTYQTQQNNNAHIRIEHNRQNIPQFSSTGNYNINVQPNTQQGRAKYDPENRLSTQRSYPVILLDSEAKIGLPFYPTSKNVYNIPNDATFQYEGIPNSEKGEQTFEARYEVSDVPAERRLYTGLTFHASSRNLYDGNTPSLRNPPLRKGDTIWQAGDETTGDEPEVLIRQLNETCAYVQWNETTPGNEDGTRYNIWNVGDYSAQLETETLVRSLNITCDNYTLDALNNFTSGYNLVDYCSQCIRNDSSDSDNPNNPEYVENQQQYYQPQIVQQQQHQQEPGYDYNNQQIYNNFYQQGPTNYEFYVDNNNPLFYKRKRYAENAKSL